MDGNVVGEKFEEFVSKQINIRQSNQFSGYGTSLRTDDQLKYLNNRNAWVKLASSVSIQEGDTVVRNTQVNSSGETIISSPTGLGGINVGFGGIVNNVNNLTNTQVLNLKSDKLRAIGIEKPESYPGSKLAEKAVLFNTLSSYNNINSPLSSSRAGISNNTDLWNDSFTYGIGGTDFGLQPPPGIIDVQVDSINRGSIRKAAVNLKAHNKFQFDLIELLYLRLGFTMMLEWGWDKYLDNNGSLQQTGNTIIEEKWFTSTGLTQLEMLGYIQKMRDRYAGNYDGFFGKVSNFTWSFNPDGTYDISIDLITVGDVIESIKANAFAKGYFLSPTFNPLEAETEAESVALSPDNVILKAAAISAVGEYLYKWVKDFSNNNQPYINISKFPVSQLKRIDGIVDYYKIISPPFRGVSTSQYYVRLGAFLSQLEGLIIPQIQNGSTEATPQICINYVIENNLVSYFPNQISLDPKICIFKPTFEYGDINGINSTFVLDGLETYVYTVSIPNQPTQTFGRLMNLYLNIEFIAGLLTSNGNPNQELSLFKFLQDICNGINNALGEVNKIEPIIKNDNIVTLIDQTLIIPVEDTTQLEVYGYNPKSTNPVSNFVKNIKFVSKITPQLASMVSIGATAAGSNTSEIDGTAFSKWSEGLVDRFSQALLDPKNLNPSSSISADRTALQNEFNGFDKVGDWGRFFAWLGGNSLPAGDVRYVDNPKYRSIDGQPMDFEKFYTAASQILRENAKNQFYYEGELQALVSSNYAVYLVYAFGGSIKDILIYSSASPIPTNFTHPLEQARYTEFNSDFINQGKGAYKNYINSLNNERYKVDNIPSSEIGFIPLSFEITLEGISGIKIYNKLNINTKFLPTNYPDSLNFIITKVNHSISNNSWDTSLSTISMPNTKPYQLSRYASTSGSNAGVTGPQPDNGQPFLIVDNRNNQAIMTVDSLLSELDPKAHPAFRKFFATLKDKYSGYKVGVNDVRRTWEESYNLKYTVGYPSQDPDNAEPGQSRHSYGLAIDINIYTPASTTKRTLVKKIKQPWIEEGIDQVATDAGLTWGGNFPSYVDAVHFEFVSNYVSSPYNQVLAQAKAIDPTLVPPFTPSANGLAKCKKIDSLIKQGRIKLQ
jgi:hypothetical protein